MGVVEDLNTGGERKIAWALKAECPAAGRGGATTADSRATAKGRASFIQGPPLGLLKGRATMP